MVGETKKKRKQDEIKEVIIENAEEREKEKMR